MGNLTMGNVTLLGALAFIVYGIHTWGFYEFLALAVVTLLFLAILGAC